jgi:hypothetical protein
MGDPTIYYTYIGDFVNYNFLPDPEDKIAVDTALASSRAHLRAFTSRIDAGKTPVVAVAAVAVPEPSTDLVKTPVYVKRRMEDAIMMPDSSIPYSEFAKLTPLIVACTSIYDVMKNITKLNTLSPVAESCPLCNRRISEICLFNYKSINGMDRHLWFCTTGCADVLIGGKSEYKCPSYCFKHVFERLKKFIEDMKLYHDLIYGLTRSLTNVRAIMKKIDDGEYGGTITLICDNVLDTVYDKDVMIVKPLSHVGRAAGHALGIGKRVDPIHTYSDYEIYKALVTACKNILDVMKNMRAKNIHQLEIMERCMICKKGISEICVFNYKTINGIDRHLKFCTTGCVVDRSSGIPKYKCPTDCFHKIFVELRYFINLIPHEFRFGRIEDHIITEIEDGKTYGEIIKLILQSVK